MQFRDRATEFVSRSFLMYFLRKGGRTGVKKSTFHIYQTVPEVEFCLFNTKLEHAKDEFKIASTCDITFLNP